MPGVNFPCQACEETFESFHALQEHIAQHKWGPHKIIEDKDGKTFVCLHPNCNKVIRSNRKVLRKHLISHQAPTHACSFPGCNRSFHERSKLKRHRLVHSGIKEYKCEHEGCGKTFAYKANMKTHMRTHTGQRPFKCSWPGCDKTFTQASNRSTHMNVHKRELKRQRSDTGSEASKWEIKLPESGKRQRTDSQMVGSMPQDSISTKVAATTDSIVSSDCSHTQSRPGNVEKMVRTVNAAQILAQFSLGTELPKSCYGPMVVPASQLMNSQAPVKGFSPLLVNQNMTAAYPNLLASVSSLHLRGIVNNSSFPAKVGFAGKQHNALQPMCAYTQGQPNVWFNQV